MPRRSAAVRTDASELLIERCVAYRCDPLGFVNGMYPWGEPPLIGIYSEPDEWQADFLDKLGIETRKRNFSPGDPPVSPVQMATASGHGIGKSALVAWIIDWIMSTRPYCRITVTANTQTQLETKTWAEIAKWTKLCYTSDWFDLSTARGSLCVKHKEHPDQWRCDGVTCRKENSEAFAGQHSAVSSSVYIFDEASAIPDVIWEVSEGGLTDGEPMHFVFGNPTLNVGRFHDCFHKFRHRWLTRRIDSRKCKLPNKELIAQWIADWGSDSDFVRVRVRGEEPRQSVSQLIPSDAVAEARLAETHATIHDPVVAGLDVAREGDDESVLFFRKGRDARTHGFRVFRERDSMKLATKVAEEINAMRMMNLGVAALFVDAGGVGGPVADRLRQLRLAPIEVNFGKAQYQSDRYDNRGTEMWTKMRDWLVAGAAIPDDPDLESQLVSRDYFTLPGSDKITLESKRDMKARGLQSPDRADALALTFAAPIAPVAPDVGVGAPSRAITEDDRDKEI